MSTLYQCFSNRGPCAKTISFTEDLVRSTNSRLKCRHTESELQWWHLLICVYKVLPVIWMHVWVRPELPNSWIFFSFLNYHLLFFSIHSSKVCTMAQKETVMEKDWENFFLIVTFHRYWYKLNSPKLFISSLFIYIIYIMQFSIDVYKNGSYWNLLSW